MVMMKNQLIKAFQRGEEWAFRKVYEQFFSPLCIYAVKYVRDASEAQDIVQDVFAALWLQHDNFNNYYTIRSFLYISVRNRSLNLLKKNSLTTEKMIRVQQNSLSEAQESEMVIETEVERRGAADRVPAGADPLHGGQVLPGDRRTAPYSHQHGEEPPHTGCEEAA